MQPSPLTGELSGRHMPETTGSYDAPRTARGSITNTFLQGITVDHLGALLVVASVGSWLGYFFITNLPYLEVDTFRATMTLHIMTAIVVVPYLISLVVMRRLPGGSPLDIAVVGILGVMILTTATSIDWRVSLEMIVPALTAVAVFYVISDKTLFKRWQIEWAFMLAVLGAAVWVIWVVVGDYIDWLQLNQAVKGDTSLDDLIPPTVLRVHGVGDFRNYLGCILAMGLPFFVVAVFRPAHAGLRMFAALGALTIAFALVPTLTRSAWAGATIAAGVSVVLMATTTQAGRDALARLRPTTASERFYVGLIALGLALAVLAILYAVNQVESRPIWLFRESASPRADALEAGWEMLQDYPVLGTGPGIYRLLYVEYSGEFDQAIHSHNGFLQNVIDSGVPGLLSMAFAAVVLGWLLLRGLRAPDDDTRLTIIACTGALIAFSVFSLFDAPNTFKGPVIALAAVGAIAVLGYRQEVEGGEPASTESRLGRIGGGTLLAARAVIPLVLAGLMVTWGRMDIGHFNYDEGLTYANSGQLELAETESQRAVDLDPEFAIYRFHLGTVQGRLYQETGDEDVLDDAIGQLQRGLELEPRSAVGYANLALLLSQTDDREGARAAALNALRYSNRDAAVALVAGTALEASNWGDDAIRAYAEAIFHDLGLADSPFWSNSEFRVARFDDVVSNSAVILNACALLWLHGQPVPPIPVPRQEALAGCVEKVLAENTREDRVVLAEALIDDGKIDLAFEQIDHVVNVYPDYGAARTALGRWYEAIGDMERAREEWLRAGQLEDVEGLRLLGDSYPAGEVPQAVIDAMRGELRGVTSEVQFHLTGILYYRYKFFRESPRTILIPGEWRDAVPGRYVRASEALERWEMERGG